MANTSNSLAYTKGMCALRTISYSYPSIGEKYLVLHQSHLLNPPKRRVGWVKGGYQWTLSIDNAP